MRTNPGWLSSDEPIPACNWDKVRYTRAVGPRPFYGESTKDYGRDHNPTSWPSGTEYQYAYCSNYRPILERCQNEVPIYVTDYPALTHQKDGQPLHELYTSTPLAINDLHKRGAVYKADDPLGTMVTEEISRTKSSPDGHRRLSMLEETNSMYTPNYRYKDFVDKTPLEISRNLDLNDSIVCKIPSATTQYYDFYNEVRMKRPRRPIRPPCKITTCRAFPLPMDKDIPNIPPSETDQCLGKFIKYAVSN